MKRKIIYVDNFLTGHGHTPTTGTNLVHLFREEGYKVITTSNRQNQFFRLFDMLYTIIANSRNSVVLIATYSTSAFYFAWACGICSRLFHIPYIPCLHGGNLPGRIIRSPKMAQQLFGNSLINVAVSGYLQKCMEDNRWKSVVIPNSIIIKAYNYKFRSHCSPNLLWVRSFHQIYNPQLAVRILSTLSHKYPGATLTMVGPDKDGSLGDCKELANKLGVEKLIRFTGLLTRDEWLKIAADCDIFINTTNFDNLPVSVVEAMALGMVTISTNVGGVPFLIDNKQNGLLVPVGDEPAFITATEHVLEDEELSGKLSSAARRKAEEFGWCQVSKSWKSLFSSIPG